MVNHLTKQISIATLLLLSTNYVNAQAGAKWATGGNSTSSGDILGTTNNQPLNFHTNNTLRMVLDANGNLKLTSLVGTTNRLVMSNSNGQLVTLPQGSSNQVLFGNGTWGVIPTPTVSGTWNTNGNKLFYNSGYVGIGISNPQFPLDVIGDARISNNLYVGGGLIITDRVSATDNVTTGSLDADSIKMGLTKAIYGLTRIEGDIDAKNKLTVTGNATFNSTLRASQGIVFDNFNNGVKVIANPLGGGNFIYGKTTGAVIPAFVPCVAQPQSFYNHQFGGTIQIYDADQAGNITPNSGLLNIQAFTNGGSSIDASVNGNIGGGNLLLNYFCGNNTIINTGVNGGTVIMGNKVTAAQSVKIGYDGTANVDPNTALTIHQSSSNSKGLVLKTYVGSLKMITIDNPNYTKSPFTVYGDGRTYIGDKTQNGTHNDALLTVNGKMVSKSCYIRIVDWADYVFADNYKIPSLYDIENYYLVNKHLPEIPSEKEVLENGIEVGEMNKLLLKKIEEMTIQLVALKKEVDSIKLKNK
jgi:hypothetical protein